MWKRIIWTVVCLAFMVGGLLAPDMMAQPAHDGSATLTEGKTTYHLSKTAELAHIVVALADQNPIWSNVVDTSTGYYQEVAQYFSPYRGHAAVVEMNRLMSKSVYKYIFTIQTGSAAVLDAGNIKSNNQLPWLREWWPKQNSLSRKKLEDFARQSNFEQFYENHLTYYEEQLRVSAEALKVDSIRLWLESEFPDKYDQYHIALSPLMNATHFTSRFTLRGQKTCWMWVPSFQPDQYRVTEAQARGIYTGVVFTEIDHNYVNPVSDDYTKRLKRALGGEYRSLWIDASGDAAMYGDGYKVFNEYMTHAVYLLYTGQKYAESDQKVIEASRIKMMVERRKYKKFAEFYTELKRLNQSRGQDARVASLYPDLLLWIERVNAEKVN